MILTQVMYVLVVFLNIICYNMLIIINSQVGSGEFVNLECGVAFRSIGYKSVKMPVRP